MTDCFLGVDVGTTNIKTVAFTTRGNELARGDRENCVQRPREGWAEQDMAATWNRTVETIREVVGALDPEDTVRGIGVTGQGGGCWLVDEDGEPVRDAVLWTDGRAAEIVTGWRKDGTYEALFDRCGYGVFPGMPVPILRWFREHDSSVIERADRIVFCKDWIRFRLTGDLASDYADASLAHHNVCGDGYVTELPEIVDVPGLARLEPRLRSPTSVAGTLTDDAAVATGLDPDTPVVTGTIDVAASAFGSGVITPGEGSTVVGTTLQNQVLMDRPRIVKPSTGYTLDLGLDGMGLRAMGAMTGTPNIDWAREELAESPDFGEVEAAAKSVPVGADGLLYHPYLSTAGEKAPFVEPTARAQFTGISPTHRRAHLLRAIYEGIAFSARDCYESLPGDPSRVTVSGGGSRSTFWCQLFADCLGADVTVPAGAELGARGAAILATVGTGRHSDLETAVDSMTETSRQHAPRSDAVSRYDRLYEYYTAVYETMSEIWPLRRTVSAELDR
jgi:sugar (pentulose or hexulose) kinase